jgi:condensin-2 complex subunit D3
VALVDPEPSLRVVAKSCLFDMLLPRAPLLAFNSFLPLLFQLNGCLEHPHHSAPLPSEEKAAFELSGPDRQQGRLQILRGLLASMSDEHRLQVTAKLCHEVLAAVLDGQMRLSAAEAVLADSLRLLACREAKVSAGAHGDDGDEAAPSASSAAAAAKGKVLSLVARKATVEAIVPIVIELKRYLEKHRSPLLRDVFLFLRELLRDHKAHLQDILSRDKQLAAEVEYDMRQLASEQASARALQSIIPAAGRRTPASAGSRPRGLPIGRAGGGTGSAPGASGLPVPTPDRLRSAMAIPKLRSHRSSLGGNCKPAGTSRLSVGGENRMGPPHVVHRAKSADDVVMASPFKEQPPLRQWNVCPSPLAQGVFDAVA